MRLAIAVALKLHPHSWRNCHQAVLPHLQFSSAIYQSC